MFHKPQVDAMISELENPENVTSEEVRSAFMSRRIESEALRDEARTVYLSCYGHH